MTREEGKTLPEPRGEVRRSIKIFRYFAGEGALMPGMLVPSERDRVHMSAIRRPIGVVGLITPWNFPSAIPAWKLAPALICGKTVVLKPASAAPLSAWRIVEALHEPGVAKGVVFCDVKEEHTIAREEIFGPVPAVMRAKDFEEAIRFANNVPFALCSSIQTTGLSRAFEYICRAEVGLLTVNLPSAGVEYQLPFGGTKDSSFGPKEQGPAAPEFYSDYKTVYLKYSVAASFRD